MYKEIKDNLKEANKGYKKEKGSSLTYYKSPKGREYYVSDYVTEPQESRAQYRVFVPGDRVIITKGNSFHQTEGLVGKTGIIVDHRFIGAYPQIEIEFDVPLNDRYKTDSWILGEDDIEHYDKKAKPDPNFDEEFWRQKDEEHTKEFHDWLNYK